MALNHNTLNMFVGVGPRPRPEDNTQTKPTRPSTDATSLGCRSDIDLIRQCLDGCEAAWNTLVARYQGLVYSIPRRYGMSPDDCDDIFQNVFTIAFRNLASLRDQTRLSAWLITITHRQCQRVYKQTPHCAELDEHMLDPQPPAPELVQRWERQHILHQAISRLDSRSQELLKALFFDASNPSYQEIAERLGMPVGSISPTRLRCFKKLETILTSMDADLFF